MSNKRRYVKLEEGEISAADLARVLGLSERRIKQLSGDNAITKNGHGRYVFPDNVQEYIEWLKKNQSQEQADLKQEHLQVQIERKREDIKRVQQERREQVEAEVWQEVQDCLSEYRSELERLDLPQEEYDKLNEAMERAVNNVRARHAERLSEDNGEG